MMTISDFFRQYSDKIDYLDLELILSRVLGRPREFVLPHPEYKLTESQMSNVKCQMSRRIKHEPLAYILGEKEFYGLKYKVNKNVLIPRPETEMLVDLSLGDLRHITDHKKTFIVDVGTGSGNIIISVAKCLLNRKQPTNHYNFFGIDLSKKALAVARQNAKIHHVDNKIKFLRGNLLKPALRYLSNVKGQLSIVITANLPYLSRAVYRSSRISVKMYEPEKALLSQNSGLFYYNKLLEQLKKLKCRTLNFRCFFEFSPEQKIPLAKLIKKHFPGSRIKFYKDLAKKWRVCNLEF